MQRHKYSTSVSIYKSAENSPKGLVSWSIKLSLKFNFPLQETVANGFKRSCAEAFSACAHMALPPNWPSLEIVFILQEL